MRTVQITFIVAVCAIIIAACSSSKKGTTPAASSSPSPVAPPAHTKPADGIYAPGEKELTAIQAQYPGATLTQLKEGHFLYTEGACIKCHEAKNIYRRGEMQWKDIIDDMARKARISDVEKDAVYKYVLAIKAAQPRAAE